jgi:UDP-3-O-[3-hydroxymyristoyl] glucosamine N-acyltransferase
VITLGELASFLGSYPDILLGSGAQGLDLGVELLDLRPLDQAGPGDLTFISDARYLPELRTTQAACVLGKEEWRSDSSAPLLSVPDPYLAYARVSPLFDRSSKPAPGVHPSAVVHSSVRLPDSVSIGPGACLEAGVELGDGVVIGQGCFLGAGVQLGAASRLAPQVVLYHGVSVGARCLVHSGTVIGCDGFGFARGPQGWEKISQLGSVRIGDDVDIGSGVTIDRGALDDTVIHDGVIIDNQVHIAHNCVIGERTAIAGCVGMAGSTVIGADCSFAGQVGISGHLKICDNAHFNGQARVARSIEEPGNYSSGTRLELTRQWARNAVRFSQLDAMHRRVLALETRLSAMLVDKASLVDEASVTEEKKPQ